MLVNYLGASGCDEWRLRPKSAEFGLSGFGNRRFATSATLYSPSIG